MQNEHGEVNVVGGGGGGVRSAGVGVDGVVVTEAHNSHLLAPYWESDHHQATPIFNVLTGAVTTSDLPEPATITGLVCRRALSGSVRAW